MNSEYLRVFKAFTDESRVRVLELLCEGEQCACVLLDDRELLRLIKVGASCFNHYCVGCGITQLNVLHNVHRRISLG